MVKSFFLKSTVLGIKSSNCSLFVLYSCRYIIFIFYSINNYTSSFFWGGGSDNFLHECLNCK